jgi:hypothetical protein
MYTTRLDPNLLRQAKLLTNSSLFVDPSDDTKYQKQIIFLVLAGEKPVSAVSSGHWENNVGGRSTVADDPHAVGNFLVSLGLAYELRPIDGHATDVLISRDPDLLLQYRQAEATNDDATIGRLYGYPASAVDAFSIDPDNLLLDLDSQAMQVANLGLDPNLATFRLSRAHWAEELGTIRRWQTILSNAGLSLSSGSTQATD